VNDNWALRNLILVSIALLAWQGMWVAIYHPDLALMHALGDGFPAGCLAMAWNRLK
jgi:hypothetical protein